MLTILDAVWPLTFESRGGGVRRVSLSLTEPHSKVVSMDNVKFIEPVRLVPSMQEPYQTVGDGM